jgi:hypothetical protein
MAQAQREQNSCSINKLNYDHREYFINKKFLLLWMLLAFTRLVIINFQVQERHWCLPPEKHHQLCPEGKPKGVWLVTGADGQSPKGSQTEGTRLVQHVTKRHFYLL